MQNAVPVGRGSMIAVLGLEMSELNDHIKNNNDNNKKHIEIANDNAAGQIIVSGDKESVLSLQKKLKENKVKTIFQSQRTFSLFIDEASGEIMKDKINKVRFNDSSLEIVNNVTAIPEKFKCDKKVINWSDLFNSKMERKYDFYVK